jgi:hypothetical protein
MGDGYHQADGWPYRNTITRRRSIMTGSGEKNPDLFIDEGWKAQVEREREQLRHAETQQTAAGTTHPAGVHASEAPELPLSSAADAQPPLDSQDAESELPPPPPASFQYLLTMLGSQALAAMGQLGAFDNSNAPRLDYAKHFIDLLGVLEEKTRNNLTVEEASQLGGWLHDMRMMYVEFARRAAEKS